MIFIKSYLFIMLFASAITSCAQVKPIVQSNKTEDTSCVDKNIALLGLQLKTTFGEEWVKGNLSEQSKLFITLTLDSLGQVVTLDRYKAEMMTKEEFDNFFSSLKQQQFCLFNGDPHLSFKDFIKYGNNRYQYTFVFPH